MIALVHNYAVELMAHNPLRTIAVSIEIDGGAQRKLTKCHHDDVKE